MTDESAPQPGNFIIMQTDVIASDRTTRETSDEDVFSITTMILAHPIDRSLAVVDRRVNIAPPRGLVCHLALVHIRQAQPNRCSPSGDAVTKITLLHDTSALLILVTRILNDHRVLLSRVPIGRQV